MFPVHHMEEPAGFALNDPEFPDLVDTEAEMPAEVPTWEEVLKEIGEKPWLTIVESNQGSPMPGSFSDDLQVLLDLQEKRQITTKDFMIRAFGARQYYRGVVSFTFQVHRIKDFRHWIVALHSWFGCIPQTSVKFTCSLLPAVNMTAFKLELPYYDESEFAIILAGLFYSQRELPV